MELGRLGVRCILVEKRKRIDPHPRASLLGARSMEYFRRHGLADRLLAAGIPTDQRYEIRFVTSLNGYLLHHYSSPSPDEYRQMHRGQRTPTPDAFWSPYFKVQIGQNTIEPILREHISTMEQVDVRTGWALTGFQQDAHGVTATVADVATGSPRQIRARYLAACDGGRSPIRQQLDIPYTGRGAIGRNRSFLFRSHQLTELARTGRANLHFVFQPKVYGVITDIDGRGLYNYSHFDPEPKVEDIDPAALLCKAMGRDFAFEILGTQDWWHHQSVADRFRAGRVFLLGDAAHLFCPTGGIGMNTAICDAFDLGWKLAATLQGWGGARLLDSYELERWPVAVRNTITAADNRDKIDTVMQTLPAAAAQDGPGGDAARAHLSIRLKWVARQFSSMGAHLGARYIDSPIVIGDGSAEPPDDPKIVSQSAWPGCRAPHAWLDQEHSTLDLFDGRHFVLLRLGDDAPPAAPFAHAAHEYKIPFQCHTIADPAIGRLYETRLVLVRPDGHVCWRGDSLPDAAGKVLATVSGH